MRLFEATGMGCLLITDKKVNNDDFFVVNKEIIEYSDPDDLVKKIKYYLKHDQKRITISRAGQRRTIKDHTYKMRMGQLNQILLKHLNLTNDEM